jgi:biopolymer transport protein ExbD
MIRETPEISAGSMADIAFLLLIFFLVTTTMDVDSGIVRKLPPPLDENVTPPKIIKRNIYTVLINSADMILITVKGQEPKPGNIKTLRRDVKEFLRPHYPDNPNFPEVEDMTLEINGKKVPYHKSKGIVSMQNDRGTSYKIYIHVQNELAGAVRELRDELAQQYYGMTFKELLKSDEKAAKQIQKAVPMAISEAEPADFGGSK